MSSAVFKDDKGGLDGKECGFPGVPRDILIGLAEKPHNLPSFPVRNDKTQVLVGDVAGVKNSAPGFLNVVSHKEIFDVGNLVSASGYIESRLVFGDGFPLCPQFIHNPVNTEGEYESNDKPCPEELACEAYSGIVDEETNSDIHVNPPLCLDGLWFFFGLVCGVVIWISLVKFARYWWGCGGGL